MLEEKILKAHVKYGVCMVTLYVVLIIFAISFFADGFVFNIVVSEEVFKKYDSYFFLLFFFAVYDKIILKVTASHYEKIKEIYYKDNKFIDSYFSDRILDLFMKTYKYRIFVSKEQAVRLKSLLSKFELIEDDNDKRTLEIILSTLAIFTRGNPSNRLCDYDSIFNKNIGYIEFALDEYLENKDIKKSRVTIEKLQKDIRDYSDSLPKHKLWEVLLR